MGHGHDAADVVLLRAVLLLGKIAHEMTTFTVIPRKHIEKKRFYVIVESLVVQKELHKKTKVLAIDLVGVAVHLEDGEVILAVDLGTWRMSPCAFFDMSLQNRL